MQFIETFFFEKSARYFVLFKIFSVSAILNRSYMKGTTHVPSPRGKPIGNGKCDPDRAFHAENLRPIGKELPAFLPFFNSFTKKEGMLSRSYYSESQD